MKSVDQVLSSSSRKFFLHLLVAVVLQENPVCSSESCQAAAEEFLGQHLGRKGLLTGQVLLDLGMLAHLLQDFVLLALLCTGQLLEESIVPSGSGSLLLLVLLELVVGFSHRSLGQLSEQFEAVFGGHLVAHELSICDHTVMFSESFEGISQSSLHIPHEILDAVVSHHNSFPLFFNSLLEGFDDVFLLELVSFDQFF